MNAADPSRQEQQALIAMLRDTYFLEARGVSRLEYGSINTSFRVEAADRTYYLKCYDGRLYSHEQVCRSLEVQNWVGTRGIPVPTLQHNARGDLVVDMPGVGVCTLSAFVDGIHYERGSIPENAARAMGRVLGQLHCALAQFETPRPYSIPDAAEAMLRLERLLRAAERVRDRSSVDAICCRVLRHKIDALQWNASSATQFPSLLAQMTHGDYQATNLLFDGAADVAAVVDFDNVQFNPRVVELSRALWLCFLRDDILLPEADAFLAGYHGVAPLSDQEIAVLAPLRSYLSCTRAWPIGDRYEKPDIYQARWDRFIDEPSDWWERNADALTERLIRIKSRLVD